MPTFKMAAVTDCRMLQKLPVTLAALSVPPIESTETGSGPGKPILQYTHHWPQVFTKFIQILTKWYDCLWVFNGFSQRIYTKYFTHLMERSLTLFIEIQNMLHYYLIIKMLCASKDVSNIINTQN